MRKIKPIFFLVAVLFVSLSSAFAQHKVTCKIYLRSNVGTIQLWDGVVTRIFGFAPMLSASPTIPGPTLFVNEGDTLVVHAYSISQNDHHSIHLHGLDADTQNDGDPSTSFMLSHGQDTTYTVICSHAGTYLYHCHVADVVHVQMGMYGMVIVRPADGGKTAWTGGPAYDQAKHWLTSEIDRSWHDVIPVEDTITHTIAIPPYRPDYFLVNGHSHQQLDEDSTRINGAVGERIYLRVANIGFFDNRIIFPSSFHARIIDSDGRPLPMAVDADTLETSPGERYGIMLTPDAEFNGSIPVHYISMNTDSVWGVEEVPCLISGYFGVAEIKPRPKLSVQPNPFSDRIMVQCTSVLDPAARVIVRDILGREVNAAFTCFRNGDAFVLETKAVATGTYFFEVWSGGQRLIAKAVHRAHE